MFSARFILKTVKVDLFVKVYHIFPRRKQPQKVPEDTRGLSTEDDHERLTWRVDRLHLQADQPVGPMGQPLLATSVSHRLKDRIYVIYSSWFDPRV